MMERENLFSRSIMVSNTLLTVLHETLNEIAEEMRSVQAEIEKSQGEIQRGQNQVTLAEDQQEAAISEDEQAKQRVEVLRTYLSRLGQPPRALMRKAKRLADEQARAADARHVAGGHIISTRQDLRGRHTQMAAAEHHYAELQKQWSEVSELISTAQRAA
jgi:chromosome segregation ATPase